MSTDSRESKTIENIDLADAAAVASDQSDCDTPEQLMERVTISDALRKGLMFTRTEQDMRISVLPAACASRRIDEVPLEIADGLIQRQDMAKAARIFDELDSDVQVDVIAQLGTRDDATGARRMVRGRQSGYGQARCVGYRDRQS